jgi:hypothetical protein
MISVYPYNCPNCQKKYKSHAYFSRHKLTCCPSSISEKSTQDHTIMSSDLLTRPSQVMQILDQLIISNNTLKQEIIELKKQNRQKKQKIDIISWLNKNFKLYIDFKIFNDQTIITRENLEYVFSSNLIESLNAIFIKQFDLNKPCPYKAFEQKENTIYVFTELSGWKILAINDFAQLISIISQGLMDVFKEWQDENYDRIFTDGFSEIYLINIKKLNSINLNTSKSLNMLYKLLYNHLKVPLNIIEYEIT